MVSTRLLAQPCRRPKNAATNTDRFIDLAQAALEEATIEEERKGVIQEVVEALINKSGAPLVAEAISEQLNYQEVIERLAELHEEDKRRRSSSPVLSNTIDTSSDLKEPEDISEINSNQTSVERGDKTMDSVLQFAEYIWRLFRVLLLASIVGLVYHFRIHS
ncbi:hypothetical protein BDB01DRAFT_779671 [Pilobolus umbonatus]|nr:hypothetical protein BDB01DRAFT_779671 [Pilobolus umbonatus]